MLARRSGRRLLTFGHYGGLPTGSSSPESTSCAVHLLVLWYLHKPSLRVLINSSSWIFINFSLPLPLSLPCQHAFLASNPRGHHHQQQQSCSRAIWSPWWVQSQSGLQELVLKIILYKKNVNFQIWVLMWQLVICSKYILEKIKWLSWFHGGSDLQS